jgi:hypothetical protein
MSFIFFVFCRGLAAALAPRPVTEFVRFLEEITVNSVAQIKASEGGSLGLELTQAVRRGDVVLEVPLAVCVTVQSARSGSKLRLAEASASEAWEPCCGDAALLAWGLLEGAAAAWLAALPRDLQLPLLEAEEPPVCAARDLRTLRADAREDHAWVAAHAMDPPSLEVWLLAVAWAISRAVEVNGLGLCLVPGADFVDHDDLLDPLDETLLCVEARAWGQPPSVRVLAAATASRGSRVIASYGAMPAAAYVERYGFLPRTGAARRVSTAAELRFELRADDRFLEDKLRILFERGAAASEDPADGFIEAAVGGEPDPETLRFLRLACLAAEDAFLLEPVFASTLWTLLAAPVSRGNERAVLEAIREEALATRAALAESVDGALYEALRCTELDALDATVRWAENDIIALPAKEYYQERRLKSLGLDVEWDIAEGNQWTGSRGTAW